MGRAMIEIILATDHSRGCRSPVGQLVRSSIRRQAMQDFTKFSRRNFVTISGRAGLTTLVAGAVGVKPEGAGPDQKNNLHFARLVRSAQ